MKKLDYKIQQILSRNRDGSHATQANRSSILSLCVEQLHEAGYKTNQLNPQDLKGRHIKALVNRWKNDGVSESTMKNRMAALRWLGEKIGNKGLVKPSNDYYGIGKRNYVTNVDKSQNLAKLSEIDKSKLSENVALSLELQQAFGLRREESMKFQAAFALGGHSPQTADKIMIKASWAKGGRYREIPITNDNQRALLEKVALVCGSGSMIPNHKSYKEHKNTFEYESRLAGVGQTHGLTTTTASRSQGSTPRGPSGCGTTGRRGRRGKPRYRRGSAPGSSTSAAGPGNGSSWTAGPTN